MGYSKFFDIVNMYYFIKCLYSFTKLGTFNDNLTNKTNKPYTYLKLLKN